MIWDDYYLLKGIQTPYSYTEVGLHYVANKFRNHSLYQPHENTLKVIKWLSKQKKITKILYPYQPSSKIYIN